MTGRRPVLKESEFMRRLRSLICLTAACLLSLFVFSFNTITAFAYVTAAVEIPVTCLEVQDGKTHIYTIKIEAENKVSPVPESDTLEISQNGTGRFKIDIDEPGTFRYKIYEKPGSDDDIKYDKNVYHITVFVENADENRLKYAVSAAVSGSDEKPKQIVFENETSVVKHSVTTGSSTADDSSSTDNGKNPLTGFFENVLNADSFMAHALRVTVLSSVLIAISAFLFKRENNEEEDKNEKKD